MTGSAKQSIAQHNIERMDCFVASAPRNDAEGSVSDFKQPPFVVPALSRDPYVDGPRAARVFDGLIGSLASICPACWCGLVNRWPRWFSATRVPNTATTFTGQWVPRIFSHLGSIDPSISPFAAPAQPIGDLADRLISQAACFDAAGIRARS